MWLIRLVLGTKFLVITEYIKVFLINFNTVKIFIPSDYCTWKISQINVIK